MKKAYVVLLGIIVFSFSVIANAEAMAISLVNTYADWDNLTIAIGTEGVNYTPWFDKSSNTSARASTSAIPQSQDGPNTINSWGSISATKNITDAKGYAYTTSALLGAETSSASDGVTNTTAWATGTTHRRGFFDMITSTSLIFQVPWSYSHNISTSLPGEYASAQSWVRFELLGANDVNGDFDDLLAWGLFGEMNNTNADGNGQFQDGPTVISLAYPGLDDGWGYGFVAGERYAFDLRVSSDSSAYGLPGNTAVPEPASMFLLGMGLMGAGFFRRKRTR